MESSQDPPPPTFGSTATRDIVLPEPFTDDNEGRLATLCTMLDTVLWQSRSVRALPTERSRQLYSSVLTRLDQAREMISGFAEMSPALPSPTPTPSAHQEQASTKKRRRGEQTSQQPTQAARRVSDILSVVSADGSVPLVALSEVIAVITNTFNVKQTRAQAENHALKLLCSKYEEASRHTWVTFIETSPSGNGVLMMLPALGTLSEASVQSFPRATQPNPVGLN